MNTPNDTICPMHRMLALALIGVVATASSAPAQLPQAEVKLWNTLPSLGRDPTESVDDPAGITNHHGTGSPTIATIYENTFCSGRPCGVTYWNPDTNLFVCYGFGSGFQAGIDINRSAPVKVDVGTGAVFGPGDTWLAKSGTPFIMHFQGTDTFREYRNINATWGVKVNQSTGEVWTTEDTSGNILLLDPATSIVRNPGRCMSSARSPMWPARAG